MPTILWSFALALAFPGTDEPPAERLKAIQKAVADAEAEYRAAVKPLGDTPEDRRKHEALAETCYQKSIKAAEAVLALAREDPKSEAGFGALEWLLMNLWVYEIPVGPQAMRLMAEHHAANPKVGRAIAFLAYYAPGESRPAHRAAVELLKAVAEKNPDRTVRGQGAVGLAWLAKRAFDVAAYRGRPEQDRLAAEAERQFEAVVRDYGDCPYLRDRGRKVPARLGEEVQPDLYKLRHLRAGKPAPEIEGENLDGKRFRLSDHRGKVVLLVFWASWCGACMSDVPHERELAERFKGRPFVLIGVNGDKDRKAALKAVAEHRIPWRSFWNGEDGHLGPIATAWNVRGWPTTYVIDQDGVIRYKGLREELLDRPLEEMVAAAEAAARARSR